MGRDAKHQSGKSMVQESDSTLNKNTDKGSRSQREGLLWGRRESRGPDKHAELA